MIFDAFPVQDYSLRLTLAMDTCQEENIRTLVNHAGLDPETLDMSVTSCPRLNVSQCVVSEVSDNFLVLVYNPLSRTVRHYVRVPVLESSGYTVIDHLGNTLETQLNEIPTHIRNVPGNINKGNPQS